MTIKIITIAVFVFTLPPPLYQKLQPLSPLQLLNTKNGDALEQFIGDVETLQNAWLRGAAPTIVAWLVSSLTVMSLAFLNLRLAVLALLGFAICGLIVPFWTGKRSSNLGIRLTQLRAVYAGHLQDMLWGREELLMLGAKNYEQQCLNAFSRQLEQVQTKLGQINADANALASASAWLTTLALIAVIAPLTRSQALPLELVGALAFGVLASFEALLPLGAAAASLERTQSAHDRLQVTLEQQPLLGQPTQPRDFPTDTRLQFEHVSFAYDAGLVLEHLDLCLEPGHWLTVIGQTGAGKSTIANLLLRFCDPTTGRITLGGVDLRELSLERLRDIVALMPQRGHVFETSIRGNLLVAKHNASESELWEALEMAELASTVRALPQGLDTTLSNNGSRLSGGERGRLLLARALLRNSSILILDEPSANLDPETERDLMRTLRRVTTNKAVLLITHRLNIVKPDDQMIALEDGQVKARGLAKEVLKNWLYQGADETDEQMSSKKLEAPEFNPDCSVNHRLSE
jgi:ATP-binding cassette, subfamily C, bacterial CydC